MLWKQFLKWVNMELHDNSTNRYIIKRCENTNVHRTFIKMKQKAQCSKADEWPNNMQQTMEYLVPDHEFFFDTCYNMNLENLMLIHKKKNKTQHTY